MFNWLRSLFRSVTPKDGDTINFKGVTVRLRGIDAPELDQPGGLEAKKYLQWIMNQCGSRLEVRVTGVDKYHRKLGVLIGQGDTDINQLMVRGGHAVAYMSEKYKADEAFARKKKLGWVGMKGFVTPSVWRKRKK